MNFKLALSALLIGSVCAFVPGCAADTTDAEDDGDAEEAETSADELSANASKFIGAFHGQGSVRPPTFQGLVFKINGTFFGDVDTGIRCITTPCPSGEHLEGKFTATKNYLTLSSKTGSRAGFYGRYRYSFSRGSFKLTRASFGASWSNKLSKEISYCAQPSDCGGQGLIHPMCVGSWTCGATNANSCGYKCGITPPPASEIWPASATKLVAQNSGGGFRPPPPAGSTCAIGYAKYSLDRSTRRLTWESCETPDNIAPATMKTGATTLTVAELAAVDTAMNGVTIATEDMCGADKPLYQITVTSPAGDKTYTDSFYRCQGGGRTYVDGINAVFSALRDGLE